MNACRNLAVLVAAAALAGCGSSSPAKKAEDSVGDEAKTAPTISRFDQFTELPAASLCSPAAKVAVTSHTEDGTAQVEVTTLADSVAQEPSVVRLQTIDGARWTENGGEWLVVACSIDGDDLAFGADDSAPSWTASAHGEPHAVRVVLAEVLHRPSSDSPWRVERTWRDRVATYENMAEITPMRATIASVGHDETGRVEVVIELVNNCGQDAEPAPPCKPPRVIRRTGGEFSELPGQP